MFAIMQIEKNVDSATFRHKMRPKCELVCKYCQRIFTKSYNLMIHERSHKSAELTSACEVCRKTMKRPETYKQHRCSQCIWR